MQRMVEKVFFALIRFEINGDELCGEMKNLITPEILPALFKLSKRHDLAHLIGDALDKNGLLPEGTEAKKRFLQERNMAVYRYEQQQYEFEQICDALEAAKISFIPLKGSVIRRYYSEPWMRTSCDIDILVKEDALVKAIEVLRDKIGYVVPNGVGVHDISLFAPSGVHLELHFTLQENQEEMDKVLNQVWENSFLGEKYKYQYYQTTEFLLFHLTAHTAYHLIVGGGCGLRPLLDIWLMEKRMKYSQSSLGELCQEAGLYVFYQKMTKLAKTCMDHNAEFDEEDEILLNYVMNSGMYGEVNNRVAVQQVKSKGKYRFLFSRLFLSYAELVQYYPILKRYKILFPIYQIVRWVKLLFGRNSKNFKEEVKANFISTEEKRAEAEQILNILAL